jgi:hypothetical protein
MPAFVRNSTICSLLSICLYFKEKKIYVGTAQSRLNVASYFIVTPYAMTNEEILQAVRQVEGLGGMTVNERLYVSGLMDEFDKSKINDKHKAAYILEVLQVDKPSIDKILS